MAPITFRLLRSVSDVAIAHNFAPKELPVVGDPRLGTKWDHAGTRFRGSVALSQRPQMMLAQIPWIMTHDRAMFAVESPNERVTFPTQWRPPSSTPTATLWAQSKRFNAKTVTVEGVAGPVVNAHRRRKVYSSAWLSDSQGMSVRVAITHIKLDSGGLVEGAYVKVTGTFMATDKDFGTPVVRVARRTLVDDSKQSWRDWAALRAQQLFAPIPHALTMSFSWEEGVNGPGNQLRYGTWLPLERGD